MIHPNMPNVPKAQIKEKLAKIFKNKEECIHVYGLKSRFGGGASSGFALVYDNPDLRKKYDAKKNLKKDGMCPKAAKTRKQKKEIKGRQKKVRGIAKAKAGASGGKKK